MCQLKYSCSARVLRQSLLWGFGEDVLYPDTIQWYFAPLSIDIFVLFTRYSLSYFVSEILFFINQIVVIVQSVRYLLLLRNNLFFLARRTIAIFLWLKPFGCEKLNKIDFKLFSPCILLCILKISRPPRHTLPTLLVTAVVVAPAVVICLYSLLMMWCRLLYVLGTQDKRKLQMSTTQSR